MRSSIEKHRKQKGCRLCQCLQAHAAQVSRYEELVGYMDTSLHPVASRPRSVQWNGLGFTCLKKSAQKHQKHANLPKSCQFGRLKSVSHCTACPFLLQRWMLRNERLIQSAGGLSVDGMTAQLQKCQSWPDCLMVQMQIHHPS